MSLQTLSASLLAVWWTAHFFLPGFVLVLMSVLFRRNAERLYGSIQNKVFSYDDLQGSVFLGIMFGVGLMWIPMGFTSNALWIGPFVYATMFAFLVFEKPLTWIVARFWPLPT